MVRNGSLGIGQIACVCVCVCLGGGGWVCQTFKVGERRTWGEAGKIAKCQEARTSLEVKSSNIHMLEAQIFRAMKLQGGQGGAREDQSDLQALVW